MKEVKKEENIKEVSKEIKKENYKATFHQDKEQVRIKNKEKEIVMEYKRKNKNKVSKKETEKEVLYQEVEEGVDLKYEVLDQKIKESVIIKSIQKEYKYDFELNIGSLTVNHNKNTNNLELKNGEEVLYEIMAPYMEDQKGHKSFDCKYDVTQVGETLYLTLEASKEWIEDKEREFPIVIDPTIVIGNSQFVSGRMIQNGEEVGSCQTLEVGAVSSTTYLAMKLEMDLYNVDARLRNTGVYEKIYKSEIEITPIYYQSNSGPVEIVLFTDEEVIDSIVVNNMVNTLPTLKINLEKYLNNLNQLNMVNYYLSVSDDPFFLNKHPMYSRTILNSAFQVIGFVQFAISNIRLNYEHYDELDSETKYKKNYQFNENDVTEVDLFTGRFTHTHDTNLLINDGKLSINVFDQYLPHASQKKDSYQKYLGNGWRSNLHQYLVRKENNKIEYIDGNNKVHEFEEKWYYELDDEKHYITKEEVYIDNDQKLKTEIDGGIYNVEYEISEVDGLQLITSSGLYNYNQVYKPTLQDRYYINLNNAKVYIFIDDDGYAHIPVYYYIAEDENEVMKEWTPNYGNIKQVNDGSLSLSNIEGVRVFNKKDRLVELTQGSNGQYYFEFTENRPYYTATYNIYVNIEKGTNINRVTKEEDFFVNEDIENINSQINSLKSYIDQQEKTVNDYKNVLLSYIRNDKEQEILGPLQENVNNSQVITDDTRNYYNNLEILQDKQEQFQISSAYRQRDEYVEKYYDAIDKLNEYRDLLTLHEQRKELLINNQMQNINDFIVDKEGNTLGFDGYGHLVLIQDKEENAIEIEYEEVDGIEDNLEKFRIARIHTKKSIVKFNYDEDTNLLKNIVDELGRTIEYEHDENENLISITQKGQKTEYSYGTNFNCITSLKKMEIFPSDGKIQSLTQYSVKDEISVETTTLSSGFDEYETIVFDIVNSPRQTKIRNNKTNKIEIYHFDRNKKMVKFEDDEYVIEYKWDEDNLVEKICYFKSVNAAIDSFPYNINALNKYQSLNVSMYKSNEYNKLPTSNIIGMRFKIKETINLSNRNINIYVNYLDKAVVRNVLPYEKEIIIPVIINRYLGAPIAFKIESDSGYITNVIERIEVINILEGNFNTYDEDNNLLTSQDGYNTLTFTYDDKHRIIQEENKHISSPLVTTKYFYNEKNELTIIEDSKGFVEERIYDDKSNVIEVKKYNKKDASLVRQEKYEYDEKGNVKSVTNPLLNKDGLETKTEYLDNKVKTPLKTISYNYDPLTGDLLSVSSSSKGINNSSSMTYKYGLMVNMSHLGVNVSYAYDGRGRVTKVSLDDEEYLSNSYEETISYNKETTTLKNGLVKVIKSNLKNQVTSEEVTFDNVEETNSYTYNAKNQLISYSGTMKVDNVTSYSETMALTYFSSNSIQKIVKRVNNVQQWQVVNSFGGLEKLNTSTLTLSDFTLTSSYTYEEDKVTSETLTYNDETITNSYKYDVLDRVIHQKVEKGNVSLCHEYSYLQQNERTLDLISEDIVKVKTLNGYLLETTTYEYDENGNITLIETDDSNIRYQYDESNRLIREDNELLNKTITYKYDKAGNILLKKEYAYTSKETLKEETKKDEYIYDCEYRDRLISFNNNLIEYDNMGRPKNIGDDTYSYTKDGRLVSIIKDGETITYNYDTQGIRRSKVKNGEETTYITKGKQILQEREGNNVITYLYNLNKVMGFVYNGSTYLYERNILGDIIRIYDEEGNIVGEYAYEAYGKHIIKIDVDGVATLNPFRYRGYYYDDETQLYYCNSRYYSPELCRWISPDSIEYLDPQSINGLNLYCYCMNNPIMYADPSGYSPKWYDVIAWIGVGLFAAAAIVLTAGLAGAVIGGVTGGIIYGAAIGTIALGTIGAGVGAIGGMIYDAVNGNDFGTSIWTWTKAGFGIGAIGGAVVGGAIGGAAAYSVTGLSNVSFWTGLGSSGEIVAGQAANSQGLITIGQTFGGKVAQFMTNIFGRTATKYIWASLSKTMASTVAMNSVTLFYGGSISATSIYMMYEYPELIKRGIEIIQQLIGG